MKTVTELDSAALIDVEDNVIGFISLYVAKQIIEQKTSDGARRWVHFHKNYKGVLPKFDGLMFWFDVINPLNVPERYLEDKQLAGF